MTRENKRSGRFFNSILPGFFFVSESESPLCIMYLQKYSQYEKNYMVCRASTNVYFSDSQSRQNDLIHLKYPQHNIIEENQKFVRFQKL